ncbi:PAS domain S-box protein [Qipengyuania sp. GH1]|uniref:PAS domain S-box protein n=1 Tax=Qipengyuania aestuarii TaxID=2867241 RepID=UPI001C8792C5|nr:PAS domain S-box protein [Qipengyuania aestuarii]MBX7535166.1 PAS domain S-box protein [Qipengyuania aestuarii]
MQSEKNLRARRLIGNLGLVVLLALAFGIFAWIGISLTRESGRVAALWIPNAIVVAAILRADRRTSIQFLLAAFIANCAANLAAGDGVALALGLSFTNTAEILMVLVALHLLHPEPYDMSRLYDLSRLVLASILAPALSACIAAVILASPGTVFSPQVWFSWAAADGLGLLIVTPVVLIGIDAWRLRRRPSLGEMREWAISILIALAVSIAIFAQTQYPFLFLVCPILIVAAFRTGITGTAVAVMIVSIVAWVATMLQSGPIMLVRGDLPTKLVVLQLFLASSFLMALPVAAALAGLAETRRELRASRDSARSILENMREVIFRTDAQGRWVFLNPAWEDLTGYTVEESLGWRTTKLLEPEFLEEAQVIYPKLASGEMCECQLEQKFTDADGTSHSILVNVRRLTDENGNFIGTAGNLRDITLRKGAEERLRESEERFRLLAEAAPVGIFQTGPDNQLSYVNSAWTHMSGLTLERAQNDGWTSAMTPEDAERISAGWAKAAELSTDYRSEFRWQHEAGGETWVDVLVQPIRRKDGEVMGHIGVSIDITERKQMELDLIEARRRAEEAAEAKSSFLANMSHELRTPMNGVLGFTDLLLSDRLTERQRRHTQLIADSGQAMMRLLNDILDISKIDAGQMQISAEPLEIRHKLRGCKNLMNPLAAQKGVDLTLDIAAAVPQFIVGDSLRLRQIVLNLLGNAVKFTHEGSISLSADIASAGPTKSLRIEVADTGIGIPADRLDAVFQSFSQAETTTARKYGGSGLGLTISHNLAKLMGGSITVESKEGEGTTFTVVLPLVEAKAPMLNQLGDEAVSAIPANMSARVLVAEDNDINQELIKAMAQRIGLDVDIAVNGQEAIDLVKAARADGTPYDMVLMDVQMPIVDGLEATRRLRAEKIDADELPIIALTANAYAEDIEACLAAGMQAHLTKPLKLKGLRDIVEQWGQGRKTLPAADVGMPLPSTLQEKYAERKRETFAKIEANLGLNRIGQNELDELKDLLHKLAGTAGLFGDDRLGVLASQLEHALLAEPARSGDLLKESLPRLRKAS